MPCARSAEPCSWISPLQRKALPTLLKRAAENWSMHQTHANLRRLALRVKAPAPVFAGEPAGCAGSVTLRW